jgi:tetratricopeptide (TPR) repeat protein
MVIYLATAAFLLSNPHTIRRMISRLSHFALGLALVGGGMAACVHTPPGTSVEVALAKRPEVVRYPQPEIPKIAAASSSSSGGALPAAPDKTELVADAYSRGEFCMKTGKSQEAIEAFREAVKIDPKFSAAWGMLAQLYEQEGQEQAAVEAFRKAKAQ